MNPLELGRSRLSRFRMFVSLCFVAVACAGNLANDGGSETHFLKTCTTRCDAGFECRCGVCTRACSTETECAAYSSAAACVANGPRLADGRCTDEAPGAFCDLSCLADRECEILGSGSRCDAGYCRRADSPKPPDESVALDCSAVDIEAADVSILGDSLIQLSPFVSRLESAVTAAGELAAGDHYFSYASAELSFLADNDFSIHRQYAMSLEQRPPRVVIMNGGATDMLQGTCGAAPSADCAQVQAALSGAEQLIARMASGGVEHIVYLSYPDPRGNLTYKAGLDVLRPLIRNACGRSPVPCHWLDLRPTFAEHDDYLAFDGIVFSETGAEAAANAVWDLMKKHCVPR